jgi:hypothetical protein
MVKIEKRQLAANRKTSRTAAMTDSYSDSHDNNYLDGETLIMDHEGKLYTLEELAGEYESEIIVACIDRHGRLTTSRAHSFRIGQWSDEIYHITFQNGHKVQATAQFPFLGASGEWIEAKDLGFGTALRGAVYDPRARNPLLSLNEVTHVHLEHLDSKIPMYDFTVESQETLFMASEIDGIVSLIVGHNSNS